MDPNRVISRYLYSSQESLIQDEGSFSVHYLPQHSAAVGRVVKTIHKALQKYQIAKLPIKHKLMFDLSGKKATKTMAYYWPPSKSPYYTNSAKSL